MRLDTNSGLHGTLVEYHETGHGTGGTAQGYAIVRRASIDAPQEGREYSTHRLETWPDGIYAFSGSYDLTLEEARADLAGLLS